MNRLKRIQAKSSGNVVGACDYDADGRRVRKTVSNGGLPGTLDNGRTDYV